MSPPLADTAVALRCCAPARCVVPPCSVLSASGRRLHCQPLSPSGRSLGASRAAPSVIPAKAGTSFPLKRCAIAHIFRVRHRAFSSAPLLGRPPAVTCRSAKAHRVFSPPTVCHLCTHASTGASPTAVRRARKHRPRRSLVPQSADPCGRGRTPGRDGAHVSVVKFLPKFWGLSFGLSSLEVGSRLFSPCVFFSQRTPPPTLQPHPPPYIEKPCQSAGFLLTF